MTDKTKTPRELALEAFERMCNLAGWGKANVIYGDMETVKKYLSQEQPEPKDD